MYIIIFILYLILLGCQHFNVNYEENQEINQVNKKTEICDSEISKNFKYKKNEVCYVKKSDKFKYQIIKMKGDGDCLYHSLSYKLKDYSNYYIETEVLNFIENNPNYLIHDTPLYQWIDYDTGLNMKKYIKQLKNTTLYPGPIEIQIFCKLFQKNVHIYETKEGKIKNTHSIYNNQNNKSKNDNLTIYYSPLHYDYIEIFKNDL
jgi:hypothetical protein